MAEIHLGILVQASITENQMKICVICINIWLVTCIMANTQICTFWLWPKNTVSDVIFSNKAFLKISFA